MNVRKPVDYNDMFAALDILMKAELPRVELYFEIGRLVSDRPEKGTAVAASEYLCGKYPDAAGFSPRNLRRMREFYRTYETAPEGLTRAMTVGWTQNVVILEVELSPRERVWYIHAVQRFGWSKLELQRKINANVHLEVVLDIPAQVCYTEENHTDLERNENDKRSFYLPRQHMPQPDGRVRNEGSGKESRTGCPIPYRVCRHQHRGDRSPVYPPARRKLAEHGIDCAGHAARQLRNSDYDRFDLLVGMDMANLRNMYRICGGDYVGKLHLLMEFAGRPDSEVADPWYTRDFEATWRDVLAGCQGLLIRCRKIKDHSGITDESMIY